MKFSKISTLLDNSSSFWNSNLDNLTKNFCQCVEAPYGNLIDEQNSKNYMKIESNDFFDHEKKTSTTNNSSEFLTKRKHLFNVKKQHSHNSRESFFNNKDKFKKSDLTSIEEIKTLPNQPKLKHTLWTKDEDRLLLYLRNDLKIKDWNIVSEKLGSRDRRQCYYRYNKLMDVNDKVPWTRQEDIKLQDLVEQYGKDFEVISQLITNHTKVDIEKRYYKRINPHRNFTNDEDVTIIQYIQNVQSPSMEELIKQLPNKSIYDVKKRINKLIKIHNLDKVHEEFNHPSISSFTSSINSSSNNLSNHSNSQHSKTLRNHNNEDKRGKYSNILDNLIDNQQDWNYLFPDISNQNNNISDFLEEDVYLEDFLRDLDFDNLKEDSSLSNNSMNVDSEFNMDKIDLNRKSKEVKNNQDFAENFIHIFQMKDSMFSEDYEDDVDAGLLMNPDIVSLVDKKKNLEQILSKITSISDGLIENLDIRNQIDMNNRKLPQISELFKKLKMKHNELKSKFKEKPKFMMKSEQDISHNLLVKIDLLMQLIKVNKLKVCLLKKLELDRN